MDAARQPTIYCFLFACSGFTGLIYESTWSQYLRLLVGHAALAQALVLAIFMGGMAAGAVLAAHLAHRRFNLLRLYAGVEGAIGLMALAFHPVFLWASTAADTSVFPSLQSIAAARLFAWVLGAALILPQSLLLGMTFPLISNGIIRLAPATPGRTLGTLYFVNTIGGAAGVLLCGFYLIGAVGLPGAMTVAGAMNIVIAIVAWRLASDLQPRPFAETTPPVFGTIPWFLLGAALLTGTASFIYEVSWIRMLAMVLGASSQAFDLMLSAFLIGLACGGLWIRRRLDGLRAPALTAANIQMCMGLLALATLPLYNFTFDLMAAFIATAPRSETGFLLFNLAGHGIAMLIMLPATFCAGMTLPLFTWMLLRQGYGERSVGHVYAANTAGAIAGVAFTLFIGMPVFSLKGAMLCGAALDMALGLAFLFMAGTGPLRRNWVPAAITCLAVLVMAGVYGNLDQRRMASTVFRAGYSGGFEDSEILFHKDGQTSTVALKRLGDTVVLTTNGKPDASLKLDGEGASRDEITMVMSAAVPLALKSDTGRVANIGLGSGQTTHTLLASTNVDRVDTVEIEPAIIEAVRHLGPRVGRVFSDPRSHIYREDARTFFATRGTAYDVIISEPSNPWVSGIASLFTEEFYAKITQRLAPGGLFVQWLQLYEMEEPLLASILKAFSMHFPKYQLYLTDRYNLLVVGSADADIGQPDASIFEPPLMAAELKRVGVPDLATFRLHWAGDQDGMADALKDYDIPANSDFFPVLDQRAAKARYLRQNAVGLIDKARSR